MRKQVSNEEFETAYKNKDNKRVISTVIKKYMRSIDLHDLQSAGMMALWRCLSYHDDSFNQKFTTSLWRFTDWECKRILRSQKNKVKCAQLSVIESDFPENQIVTDNEKYIKECIHLLPTSDKSILELYYYDNRTMDEIGKLNGYSKEAARQKINKSLKKLQEIFNRERIK